ncbi:MAG: hypothetical protein ACT4NU_11845 [Chromatiales bacterium]
MNRITAAWAFAALVTASNAAHALGALTDIQIYDRSERRHLPVYEHNGRYYMVGKPGNEYQIQVRNQSGGDVLTVVSVDGINVVSGETANWDQSGYVLEPWNSMDIRGWRKNLERTAAFYFTRLPDSYAARTGRPDNVGVIGVAVFQRRMDVIPDPVPLTQEDNAAEPARPFGYSRAPAPSGRAGVGAEAQSKALRQRRNEADIRRDEGRLGTGHGRSETSYARYTTFDRATAAPAEVVTIYYDSYRNLVAQGIIPAERDIRPLAASPFPGQFVPDPPR